MGIEVLYGNYYAQNWKIWLKENGRYIDFAILSRPHISIKYIDEVRENTNAKVFYYGHDIHFLRESREYALTNDEEKLKSAEKWKKMELSLMKKADVVYFFSTVEISIIKEMDSSINCRVVPLNIFSKNDLQPYNCNRKDIIFVGGFRHSPNVDGILWFVNSVMPLIRNAIPGILLYIIGSEAPSDIIELEKDDIRILGYVDDDTLDEYYKKCRVCIAPLRYGAGVKGKVLEAMYKQIPLITTTIGAEGLSDIDDCLIIENDPEQFAQKLINMYNNDKLLRELVEKSYFYIMKYFTIDRYKSIIKEDFDIGHL
jgi:glycosyltransferase involved in cell wall biosynthesis